MNMNSKHKRFLEKMLLLILVLAGTALLMYAVGHWAEHGWILIPLAVYLIIVTIYQVYFRNTGISLVKKRNKLIINIAGWISFLCVSGGLIIYSGHWKELKWVYFLISGLVVLYILYQIFYRKPVK